MSKLTNLPEIAHVARHTHGFFDDFSDYVDGTYWTVTADTGGTAAVGDAAGGIMTVTSDGDDNDETYLERDNETFKFADDKPLMLEALVNFTEANTDDGSLFVGVVDAVAADLLVDNGAGPKTTASGAGFEKRDGETVWRAWSSIGTTQTSTKLEAANKNNLSGLDQTTGAGSDETLRVEFEPITSTRGHFHFFINGTHVASHREVDYSSATEMQFGLGAKAGGANAEALLCDYAMCYQKR